jgi:FemAB family protein
MSDKYIQIIRDHLKEISFRKDQKKLWDDVINQCNYVPHVYLNSWIDFQFQLLNDGKLTYDDLSLIIKFQDKGIAILPLILLKDCVNKNEDYKKFILINEPIFISNLSRKIKDSVIQKCINIFSNICMHYGLSEWESFSTFRENFGVTGWQQSCLKHGAKESINYEFYIDLRLSIDEIKNCMRRSYRGLVSLKNNHELSLHLLNVSDIAIWDEFKKLHIKVSGRQTRSNESWRIQMQAIEKQEGLLIYIRDLSGVMQGGAFFFYTNSEAVYASGAYNRGMKDENLGHLSIFNAIEELKKLNIRWLRLGEGFFGDSIQGLSEKEKSINFFKQGFATNIFRSIRLKVSLDNI